MANREERARYGTVGSITGKLENGRMQPQERNFGTAVSSFLRESDLALEARSDPRRCKIPTPESYSRGGVAVLAPGMAAKVQIRNQRM
jgi:hypothetical protein